MVDADLDRMERDAREVAEARAALAEPYVGPDGRINPTWMRIERHAAAMILFHVEADVLALIAEVRRLRAARPDEGGR
jgi:hypothetical protein